MERNVPKLRFKGFNDEWEEKKIKETLKIKHGKDQKKVVCEDGKYSILGTGGEIGRTNTPLYMKESVLIGRKGTIDRPFYMKEPFWTVDTLFYSEINEKYFPKFIYYKFQNINWKKYCEASGVPSLSASTIESIKYRLPSLQEQERIANFLTKVDKIIEKQDEKVKNLEKYKKGMMQKIFSQEIRFKDENGEDYPEWEEVKVKDIFNITRGQVIAKSNISQEKKEFNIYPVYSSQTTNDGILGYDSDYDFDGDFLTWTTDGANAGKVFRRKGKFKCTNVCGLLVEKEETKGYANNCIKELLERITPRYVSYVGNPKLMNGVMAEITLLVPCIDEQIKIDRVLLNLDLIIRKEINKLEELKNWKKGLLQQLFV